MNKTNTWLFSKTDVFWSQEASGDHVLHLYENEESFMDMLAGFAGAGINAGDGVVIIANEAHLVGLYTRLNEHGIFVDSLIEENRYIPLRAEEVLKEFMIDGLPDEKLFMDTVDRVITLAKGNNRKVRAFGEMVALLWSEGNKEATVMLEELWNKYCQNEELSLFCAYPWKLLVKNADESVMKICSCHSKMIYATDKPLTDILYEDMKQAAV